jgi:hypothetical protein
VTPRRNAVYRRSNRNKNSRLGGTKKASASSKRKNSGSERRNGPLEMPHGEEGRPVGVERVRARAKIGRTKRTTIEGKAAEKSRRIRHRLVLHLRSRRPSTKAPSEAEAEDAAIVAEEAGQEAVAYLDDSAMTLRRRGCRRRVRRNRYE